ncbi:YncE family protein [Mycobacterium sp. 4D054]|uniref:YncE family protein n=1 Tax=Mycobacterium sp. 4D054 TaxID=3457440 RepID=UPI003FD17FF6
MSRHINSPGHLVRLGIAALALTLVTGCSSNPVDAPPPTIEPARAADSPPVTTAPQGQVSPLAADALTAAFDAATGSLLVLSAGSDGATLTVVGRSGAQTPVTLAGPATAVTTDGEGRAFLSTRGGYYRFDIAAGAATKVDVEGHDGVDFTAIARRSDGRLVLGSADGTVYTLASERSVGAQLKIFARVDALVTQGDTAVVLDRGQTSVTSLNVEGTKSEHALRAGEGATTMAADGAGRVLVTDTRGGELLVYGLNPLILRQRYPVPGSPYGVAGSAGRNGLAWVAQTATNTVVGYDLATGIPVEKVRYRTVRQPNSVAFDDTSNTLYVVSGAGAGVQVIPEAAP